MDDKTTKTKTSREEISTEQQSNNNNPVKRINMPYHRYNNGNGRRNYGNKLVYTTFNFTAKLLSGH